MLLSSSNRKYQPYPFFSYVPMVVCLRCCYIIFCHLLLIHSGKTEILFSVLLCSLWWVQIVGCLLVCRLGLFICTLSHLIIIIAQTYLKTLNLQNACQIYFVECIRLSLFLSYSLCNIWGCVFSVYQFPLWWLREYTLCLINIIKSEVWAIIHCLGLGHETMVCAVCLCILTCTYLWPDLISRMQNSTTEVWIF